MGQVRPSVSELLLPGNLGLADGCSQAAFGFIGRMQQMPDSFILFGTGALHHIAVFLAEWVPPGGFGFQQVVLVAA